MDFDQILPYLFVGACPRTTDDVDRLSRSAITAVLNLQTEEDFAYWGIDWNELAPHYIRQGIVVRRTPIRDFDPEALRKNLPHCVKALDDLIRDDHTVYVHCSAGINRSPSTVIAYLHWIEGWDWDRAVSHVVSRRACDPYLEAIRLATEDRTASS